MTDIRAMFCDAAAPLVADPAVKEGFDGPSALAEFSVRGLAPEALPGAWAEMAGRLRALARRERDAVEALRVL